MSAFVKFDPWAALAAVKRTGDKPKTLAGLATLAVGHLKTENLDNGNSPTVTTKGVNRYGGECHGNNNPISRSTTAKIAKVAKVAEPFPFADALDRLERRCPNYIESARWQQCVEDAQRFLADWADKAAALGWTTEELFGLHTPPANPYPSYNRLSRYDATGLIWGLQGRRVVALTEETAAIQTTAGVTVYRRHRKPALGPLGDSLDDFA